MKKFILFIGLLFLFLINVEAIDYDITDYYIKANILDNGDMDVSELIVLKGTFNGYEREVAFKNSRLSSYNEINFEQDAIYNASDITKYSAKAKHITNVGFDTFDEDFEDLIPVESPYNAKKGNVYISQYSNYKTFRMYYKTNGTKTAFYLNYTVKDAIVMHNDVAELYWTFIGEDFTDKINNLNIRVYLPQIDNSDYFRVWAHGDLTGEIHKYDNYFMEATVQTVYPNSPVDIRTTFDKNLITNSNFSKTSNIDALSKIIAVETNRANKANKEREKNKKIYYTTIVISSIIFLWQVISILIIYKKYDKEYKSDFNNDYNREFIEEYNVEIVDYIMNKKISPNAMSASIMNMIYKKNIKIEKIEDSKKEEYIFTFLNNNNLNETENILIDFLFQKIGNGETFTTKELKNYAKSTKTYNKFTSSFTNWKNKVCYEGKKLKIFESHLKVTVYSVFMLIITNIINTIAIALNSYTIILSLNNILAFFIMIYCILFKKRTKYGNEHYVRWKAFKKFLEDFGNFKDKDLPEITLWEKYMVYATVFGIADKVAKTMNVKIKELQENGLFMDSYIPYHYHCNLATSINSAINSAVSSAHATAARVASSSHSSGSGFGGGFSSGSGFGGGGGGGHGF